MQTTLASATTLGSIQLNPAMPVHLYSDVTGRCQCGCTIMLRVDGQWTHGPVRGIYCREG